jgi:copper chaperone CopZ
MGMNKYLHLILLALRLSTSPSLAQPVEAGKVAWSRDFESGLVASTKTKKPVFLLFQEIPGCAGCRQFGQEVLSHPLLVEAIETEFTPVLIHNNKPGKDEEILQRYGEPSWNFQVVRFLGGDGLDLIPRKDKVWDTHGLASRMILTLEKAQRPIPNYLRLLAAETAPGLSSAMFSMHCFWAGEAALGQMEGVLSTEAGFANGKEVVAVKFDPATVSLATLKKQALSQRMQLEPTDSPYKAAPASDQKKQLEGGSWDKRLLTAAQATKLNAWIRVDEAKAVGYISPTQLKLSR